MTARSIYAWLVRLHPRAFRERFEQDMLWVFDETVRTRGGIILIADAALSLARQWILRSRKPVATVGAPPQRSSFFRGLTPEIHFLILWIPFGFALPLLTSPPEDITPGWLPAFGYAGEALLLVAWYRLYKRRLLRAPLAAPTSLAHRSYRLQLEDSLKTIRWLSGAQRYGFRGLVIAVWSVSFMGVWDYLGGPRVHFSAPVLCYVLSWAGLASRLNRYAVETLEREIERLPENS